MFFLYNALTEEFESVYSFADDGLEFEDCCAVLYENEIIIFGGIVGGVHSDQVIRYNIDSNTYTFGTNMIYPRTDHTC